MAQSAWLPSLFHSFDRRRYAGLRCAIPQDRIVPSLLRREAWAFRGTLAPARPAPPDLNRVAAHARIDLTGHHLSVVLRDARA